MWQKYRHHTQTWDDFLGHYNGGLETQFGAWRYEEVYDLQGSSRVCSQLSRIAILHSYGCRRKLRMPEESNKTLNRLGVSIDSLSFALLCALRKRTLSNLSLLIHSSYKGPAALRTRSRYTAGLNGSLTLYLSKAPLSPPSPPRNDHPASNLIMLPISPEKNPMRQNT